MGRATEGRRGSVCRQAASPDGIDAAPPAGRFGSHSSIRSPAAAPADRCNADRTSIPTAPPIPTARPIGPTTTRRTDPSTARRSESPPPATPTDSVRSDRQPIRKPISAHFTASLFPDPTDNRDATVPENSTPANSGIPDPSTTAIPRPPNAKWGTLDGHASVIREMGFHKRTEASFDPESTCGRRRSGRPPSWSSTG